eukprot:gb/GECG01013315.1/.p1 GENE.gb/GECG01013315.1/~~gb/GECG01013315.1/.p1  ORF type:complete len:580 (+),score=74.86 gb/GECG01013315.1/:1-1740(+)
MQSTWNRDINPATAEGQVPPVYLPPEARGEEEAPLIVTIPEDANSPSTSGTTSQEKTPSENLQRSQTTPVAPSEGNDRYGQSNGSNTPYRKAKDGSTPISRSQSTNVGCPCSTIREQDTENEDQQAEQREQEMKRQFTRMDTGKLENVLNEDAWKNSRSFQITSEERVGPQGIVFRDAPNCSEEETVGARNCIPLDRIGSGASGMVVKSVHADTFTLLAIKSIVLKPKEIRGEFRTLMKNFARIYRPTAEVPEDCVRIPEVPPCPFIVGFYGAFTDNDRTLNLAMEYMDKGNLTQEVKRRGPFSESRIAAVAYPILRGLLFLHENNIYHRDLKPENVLLNSDGEVKLVDFGIARANDSDQMVQTGAGTRKYMSPERLHGYPYDSSCDLWSFGLTMMYCALGRYPYEASQEIQLVVEIENEEAPALPADTFSEEARDFISSCLQKDPAKRPAAKALLEHEFLRKHSSARNYQTKLRDHSGMFSRAKDIPAGFKENVKDVVAQIQFYRFYAAKSKGKSLKSVGMRKISWLARQLGVPASYLLEKFESTNQSANQLLASKVRGSGSRAREELGRILEHEAHQ